MADIKQAAKWMDEHRDVKRSGWKYDDCIMMARSGAVIRSFGGEFEFTIFDLLADDWEIAE